MATALIKSPLGRIDFCLCNVIDIVSVSSLVLQANFIASFQYLKINTRTQHHSQAH